MASGPHHLVDRLFGALNDTNVSDSAYFKLACRQTAEALGADQVGVWRRNPTQETLTCALSYGRRIGQFSSGEVIELAAAPIFANAIKCANSSAITCLADEDGPTSRHVSDAPKDGATSIAFARVNGASEPIGLVSVAMTNGPRQWRDDELAHLRAMAGVTGLAWERAEWRATVDALDTTKHEAELAHSRLINAINELPDGFVLYDSDDRLVLCNDRYREIYSHVADVIVPGAQFERIIRTGVERGMQPEAAGREEEWVAERLAAHRNPKESTEQELPGDRWLKVTEGRTDKGDVVGFRSDITALKRQQRELEQLTTALAASNAKAEHEALHDGLTGLPNRRHLDRYLAQLDAPANGVGPADNIYLLHVDLDHFKQINDTLGHSAGDYVLSAVAQILLDSTSQEDFVARVGGDEFVILCHAKTTDDRVRLVADLLVSELSSPIEYDGHQCRFGASVGVAMSTVAEASELMVNADIALYEAKALGRGRFEIFSSEMHDRHVSKRRLADALMNGLESGAFTPFFQPQFSASDFSLAGVEALVRWRHPTLGLLTPNAFLPLAEELGVLAQIDRIVFRGAVEACRRLAERGVDIPKLAVNTSLERLREGQLIQDVALGDKDPRIALELVETIYFDDQSDEVQVTLDLLRESGVELEVDDFGSGHASIVSLMKIKPNRLKIDRNLVMPMTHSTDYHRLTTAIVKIGQLQGIQVTAEGVETAAHAEMLREAGCDHLQGFYFARPMPEAALLDFLQEGNWPKPKIEPARTSLVVDA